MEPVRIRVHGYHIDVFDHVNNARYLEFIEAGRWAMLGAADAANWLGERGYGLAVVNINIDFRSAAVLGDELTVHSRVERIGGRSMTLRQRVDRDNGETAVEADVVFVITGPNGAVPLTGEALDWVRRLPES